MLEDGKRQRNYLASFQRDLLGRLVKSLIVKMIIFSLQDDRATSLITSARFNTIIQVLYPFCNVLEDGKRQRNYLASFQRDLLGRLVKSLIVKMIIFSLQDDRAFQFVGIDIVQVIIFQLYSHLAHSEWCDREWSCYSVIVRYHGTMGHEN